MTEYCEKPCCRREFIIKYFGEVPKDGVCNKTCDYCLNPEKVKKDIELAVGSSGFGSKSSFDQSFLEYQKTYGSKTVTIDLDEYDDSITQFSDEEQDEVVEKFRQRYAEARGLRQSNSSSKRIVTSSHVHNMNSNEAIQKRQEEQAKKQNEQSNKSQHPSAVPMLTNPHANDYLDKLFNNLAKEEKKQNNYRQPSGFVSASSFLSRQSAATSQTRPAFGEEPDAKRRKVTSGSNFSKIGNPFKQAKQ